MAQFAKLDENNKVIEVHVLNDAVIIDENGDEQEQLGIDFLSNLFEGGSWKQSFKNGTRKNRAGIGTQYDSVRDAFIFKNSYSSWILNEDTCQWEPPVPMPSDGKIYTWNEATTSWDEIE